MNRDISLSKVFYTLLVLSILVALFWYISDIFFYLITSAVLGVLGTPIVNVIAKYQIKNYIIGRTFAAFLVLLIYWGILLLALFYIVPILFQGIYSITKADISRIFELITPTLVAIEDIINDIIPTSEFSIRNFLETEYLKLSQKSINYLGLFDSATSMVSRILIGVFSVTFITFYFLKVPTMFVDGLVAFFPEKHSNPIKKAMKSITRLLKSYFWGIAIESLIKFIFVSLGLVLCGLPVQIAIIIGFISGVLNVIPYVGPLLGILIGLVLNLTGNVGTVEEMGNSTLWIIIIMLIFQMIDNFIIQPKIYGDSVKSHPLEIFLVILIAGNLVGVVGMLLAIPIYTISRVFAKEFLYNFNIVRKLTEKI